MVDDNTWRGWQTIISWPARRDVFDGRKKLLDCFEEIGDVVDTSPSLALRCESSLEVIHNVEARSTLGTIMYYHQ